jgi:hypothetical protein
MRQLVTITFCLVLGLSCKPIPDPISQQFGGQTIQLPQNFDTWQLNLNVTASQIATDFATQVYASDQLATFAYGENGIAGFAIEFETEFEAQRRHAAGVILIQGTQSVLATESETLAAYDCVYFFESENPSLMFHIDNHVVFLNAISTGVSRTSSVRRAIAFIERVFEVNDRLGTRPLRAFQLDVLEVLPSNATPIQPGPTRFEINLSYIVEDRPEAFVSAQLRWFKAGRGLIVQGDSTRVQRGTGEVRFSLDVDLSDGVLSDILSLRAHISYPSSNGGGVVPTTSLIDPIRYNIARTNN